LNVYVETNFVFELVFEQQQAEFCEQIIAVCESSNAHLIVPAYCLAEPYWKLHGLQQARDELQRRLADQIKHLRRSVSSSDRIQQMAELSTLLVQISDDEARQFNFYRGRIVEIAHVLELTSGVIKQAASFEQRLGLSRQDALVYSSVVTHLSAVELSASCFLNKNTKDFLVPQIKEQLDSFNCKLIPDFKQGLEYVLASGAS
jgi:hypothetical protein